MSPCGRIFIACSLALFLLFGRSERALGFSLNGYSWPAGSQIQMHLQLTRPPVVLQDGSPSWNASAEDALAIWNQYLDTVSFVAAAPTGASGGDGANSVFFASTVYGETFPTGVLAVTLNESSSGSGVFAETDVIFNSGIKWNSYRGPIQGSGPSGTYDLHRVALHEFGHVLGLDHPDEHGQSVTAIMNSIISDLDHLADDDVTGGRFLYQFRITSSLAPISAYLEDPFAYQIAGNNNPASFSATGLPPGLQLDPDTGVISGKPTTAGTFQVTIVAHGAGGDVTGSFQIFVSNAPRFTNPLNIICNVGDPVSFPLTTNVPASNISFNYLPYGLQMDTNGVIFGAAIRSGSFEIPVTATTANGTITATLHFTIGPRIHSFQTYLDLNETSQASPMTFNSFYRPIHGLRVVRDEFNRVTVETEIGTVRLQFQGTGFQPLKPGVYEGVTDTYGNPGQNALEISGGGCLDGSAKFTIKEVTYGPLETVLSFWATFEHQCPDGWREKRTGEIRYHVDANDPLVGVPVVSALGAIEVNQGQETVFLIHGTNGPTSYTAFGLPYGLGCSPITGKITGAPLVAGTFVARLFATNSAGTGEAKITITVHPGPARPHSLLNVSTRGQVGTGDDIVIGGFIITGTELKTVVMRGMGPSIPVAGSLADPLLRISFPEGYQVLYDNWIDVYNPIYPGPWEGFTSTNLAPGNRLESGAFYSLAPGPYTIGLSGNNNTTGIGLVEAYDISPYASSLANISTRGKVGGADNVLIGGFILGGSEATNVVIRGIGPSLSKSGVSGALLDPTIALHDGNGALLAQNDNWRQNQQQPLIASGLAPTDDREAALLLVLQPGAYTAIVRGKNDTTGIGLFEIYNLDAN